MTTQQPRFRDIQVIAFDLDGTLVNSVPGLTKALQITFHDLNLPSVTESNVAHWVGNGTEKMIERGLLHVKAPVALLPKAQTLFNDYYAKTITSGTVLFPHVKETLQTLKKNGYPLALVTNKPSQFLPDLLQFLQIDGDFSLCLGGGDVIKLKPHPAPLYKLMGDFGIYHDQLLFVGDSKNDIIAAKNAQCHTIGLSYGYNYGESIAESQPDVICDHFKDILLYMPLPKSHPEK